MKDEGRNPLHTDQISIVMAKIGSSPVYSHIQQPFIVDVRVDAMDSNIPMVKQPFTNNYN